MTVEAQDARRTTGSFQAYAKLNLALQVVGRTADGFHALRSVMIAVRRGDALTLEATWEPTPKDAGGNTAVHLVVEGASQDIPTDDTNLVVRATRAFLQTVDASSAWQRPAALSYRLRKRIPPGGGLGGGSADAAAALHLLAALPQTPVSPACLMDIAARVGSDVPFALRGGAALAEGRGERLTPLAHPVPFWVVLVRPPLAIATPWCFRRWDELFLSADGTVRRSETDLAPTDADGALSGLVQALAAGDVAGVGRHMFNDLEPPVLREYPHLAAVSDTLRDAGCCGAMMTGSGSCFFGLAPDLTTVRQAVRAIRRKNLGKAWVTKTAGPLEGAAEKPRRPGAGDSHEAGVQK